MSNQTEPPAMASGWRVSNRVFLWLAVMVIILTWAMLIIAYPALPARIPGHFGLSGVPDAMVARSWWSVFLPGMLQIVLTAGLAWLSHHPEYSNLPIGLALRLVPEPAAGTIKRLIAHLLVMTSLIVDLIMAYISLAVIQVGLGLAERLNSWAVLSLTGFLLLLVIVYSIWVARLTRRSRSIGSGQSGS